MSEQPEMININHMLNQLQSIENNYGEFISIHIFCDGSGSINDKDGYALETFVDIMGLLDSINYLVKENK